MTQMDSSRRTGVVGALDRRTLLSRSAAGAMALAAPAILRSSPARAQAKVVNISGYGGVVNEYLTKLFGIPFEKKTGIKVNFGSNASLALAKLQATSGGPAQWDLISLTGNEYYVAIDQKLIVPYDYSIINTSHVQPEYKLPYGIKFSLFLFVMAWDQRQIPDDKAPQSWAEFWDTSRFKGKRSLYANISDGCTLECALLADGVPLDKLYPLDVNRALRSLERLGRDNIIWYNTNQEPIQQLTSGAVGLANAFDGRVILANRAGGTLGFTPAYGGVSGNAYCVSAASERKTEAFQFLDYMLNEAKADAEYMELSNYAVPNTAALELVSKSVRDILPTSPSLKDKVFIKDDHWWAENLAQATTAFKTWQLSG
ncbi:MAG: extracellular solute-binding protein [Acetobacteraceae bacterium]